MILAFSDRGFRDAPARHRRGEDALDIAFLTSVRGAVQRHDMEISALVSTLPYDDVTDLVTLG